MTISFNTKIILGVFTIVIGLFLMGFDLVKTSLGLSIVNAGAIITLFSYIYLKRGENLRHDERSRAIGAKAASYSWMFTFFLIAVLVWLLEYNIINLSVSALLGIILAEMALTLLISKWYLNKKSLNEN